MQQAIILDIQRHLELMGPHYNFLFFGNKLNFSNLRVNQRDRTNIVFLRNLQRKVFGMLNVKLRNFSLNLFSNFELLL